MNEKSNLERVHWLCENPELLKGNRVEKTIFWRLQKAGFYSKHSRFTDCQTSIRFCIKWAQQRLNQPDFWDRKCKICGASRNKCCC